MRHDDDVAVRITVTLLESSPVQTEPSRIRATLQYRVDDPYAVRLCFGDCASRDTVVWTVDRHMLAAGLVADHGTGDIRIWPAPDNHTVNVELRAPGGRALFSFPAVELTTFLARTFDLVALGHESEHIDLDTELRALLDRQRH
jgi:hypothetical protein